MTSRKVLKLVKSKAAQRLNSDSGEWRNAECFGDLDHKKAFWKPNLQRPQRSKTSALTGEI